MVQPEEEEEDGDCLPPRESAVAFYTKYDAREVLGRGITSTVRRAVLKDTGESFAVKIIDISQNMVDSDGLNLREQTLREVNILRMVAGHENIIELIDVFESVTFIFIIFELCVNGELFDYLNSVVALSEKRARRVMRQVAEALHHCHKKGVVHRDIKPENILLDKDLNVKLTDFGFAKVLQAGDRLYEVCGTPGYLAPELLKAGMLEERDCSGYGLAVDVWACGVVLYTLLAGFPPFWHRKQLMMIRQIMEGRYTFAGTEWADVSHSPKNLIGRMLEVEPEDRPTIGECLRHEFFQSHSRRNSLASGSSLAAPQDSVLLALRSSLARRRWRVVIIQLRFMARLQRIKVTAESVSLALASEQPYGNKAVRRVVDGGAFRIYGHWVKRGGSEQNRAAMFQSRPKTDIRQKMKEEAALSRASLPLQGVGGS